MNKIIAIKQAIELSKKLKNQGKTIVLAGGCFDILHTGHIEFLKNAGQQGDVLFVMLESDESVKKSKGENRPVNNQMNRAKVLAGQSAVDYVILLPELNNNREYDRLVENLQPDILATTDNDPFIAHKQRQAKLVGAKVVSVIKRIPDTSTTGLISNYRQTV